MRRPRHAAIRTTLALAAGLIALASPAGILALPQNVPTKPPMADPKDRTPFPDATARAASKRISDNKPLFTATDQLVFSLVADFGQIQRDREPDSTTTYPATIVVAQRDGKEISIPVHMRTRGHSRLKPDFCTFAPLRITFDKNPIGTVFEGQDKLKLGVHCRDAGDFPQYVLREYPVYRMFNLLTPRSFRARLAEAHYVDAKSKKTINVRDALFLEDDDDVARRLEGRISDTTGLSSRRIDASTTTLMMLYEYMVGNTDLSIRSLHNVRVVLTADGTRYPVPYDFDFTGVVNAQYAVPNPMLKMATVRDRMYLGPCYPPTELAEALQRFRTAHDQLLGVYDTVPNLKPRYVVEAKKFLEKFFDTIAQPSSVTREFIKGCGRQPYL